jgi:hypothetical protein
MFASRKIWSQEDGVHGEKQDVIDNILQVMCHIFQRNIHTVMFGECVNGVYKRQVNLIVGITLW